MCSSALLVIMTVVVLVNMIGVLLASMCCVLLVMAGVGITDVVLVIEPV